MSTQHRDELEVVVVATEGVQESLSDLKPTDIEEQLEKGEKRNVEVYIVSRVTLLGVQELLSDQGKEEERIHRQRHHLE